MSLYQDRCKAACELCAKGERVLPATRVHLVDEPFRPSGIPCTAPSRDQFEQELQARIAELEEFQRRVDNGAMMRDLDEQIVAKNQRIAELERENAQIRDERDRFMALSQDQADTLKDCADAIVDLRRENGELRKHIAVVASHPDDAAMQGAGEQK